MKYLKFLLTGILFGIIMTKSEAISWYRIQEMFRFQSFHMYGIIGVAVVGGILLHLWIKKTKLKSVNGKEIEFNDKAPIYKASLFGGIIFGLGWAITGACPGPLYTLIGNGYFIVISLIFGAILGTYVYGLLRDKLPH